MIKNDLLAESINHTAKDKLITLIYNRYGVEPYFILSANFKDTDYRYDMYIPHTTNNMTREIQLYSIGIIDTLKSF